MWCENIYILCEVVLKAITIKINYEKQNELFFQLAYYKN